MKKHILFFLAIIFSSFINAQVKIDSLNGKIYLETVHEVDLKKGELKSKANDWIAKNFNNSNYVIKINSEDKILVRGQFKAGAYFSSYGATVYSPRDVDFILDLKFKDGRYKTEILDITLTGAGIQHGFETYFMDLESYREYSKKMLESYDGLGKKAGLKRLNNDKKFKKSYDANKKYGAQIIEQVIRKIEDIDKSILVNMNSRKKDDW